MFNPHNYGGDNGGSGGFMDHFLTTAPHHSLMDPAVLYSAPHHRQQQQPPPYLIPTLNPLLPPLPHSSVPISLQSSASQAGMAAYQQQQPMFRGGGQQQSRRNARDTLLSMRKHRSLDGAQFLAQFADGVALADDQPHPHPHAPSAFSHYLPSVPYQNFHHYYQNANNMNMHLDSIPSAAPPPPHHFMTPPPLSAPILHHQQQQPSAPEATASRMTTAPGNPAAADGAQQLLLARAPATAVSTSRPHLMSQSHHRQPPQQPSCSSASHTFYSHNPGNNPISVVTSSGDGNPFPGNNPHGPPHQNPAANGDGNEGDPLANAWSFYQPVSAQAILQQIKFDLPALQREFSSLCDRFNYLAASVRTFWAPELRRERQRLREETVRANQLEQRVFQQSAEVHMLRTELERTLVAEARQTAASSNAMPSHHLHNRDFTDHSITVHEWQTLKTRLERSELSLADRTRELQSAEMRAKCAEEQKCELERRNEIMTRSLADNETQLKLLHEDLNMLRGKLELKNQQLDKREKANKKLESDVDSTRAELKESQHNLQESERRITQLTNRIDQLERELRDREVQLEKLRQRLQQQPSARIETELLQKLENAMEDRRKFEQLVDQLRAQNETERQQQLQQFLGEREQLQANIAFLKKELADRHVLIGSQNEKISQINRGSRGQQQNEQQRLSANGNDQQQGDNRERGTASMDQQQRQQQQLMAAEELERTHLEVDRLLKRVQQLEREKAELCAKRGGFIRDQQTNVLMDTGLEAICCSTLTEESSAGGAADQRVNSLWQRIRDLEEALRESVECTTEKEKALTEQKRIVEKLSSQITEMFDSGSAIASSQRRQAQHDDALLHLADTQRQLEEERQQRQRQVAAIRKELGMALVSEKENAIALAQSCYPSLDLVPGLREKMDALHKQKEALKHALLMGGGEECGEHHFGGTTAAGAGAVPRSSLSTALVQPGRPLSVAALAYPYSHQQQHQHLLLATSSLAQPIHVQTAGIHSISNGNAQLGVSAPASLDLFSRMQDEFNVANTAQHQVDEDGIWA